jgi:hypothetical protein
MIQETRVTHRVVQKTAILAVIQRALALGIVLAELESRPIPLLVLSASKIILLLSWAEVHLARVNMDAVK